MNLSAERVNHEAKPERYAREESPFPKRSKTLGLVLEGGGAKGAFQVGCFRALREFNIEFDAVAGTSRVSRV